MSIYDYIKLNEADQAEAYWSVITDPKPIEKLRASDPWLDLKGSSELRKCSFFLILLVSLSCTRGDVFNSSSKVDAKYLSSSGSQSYHSDTMEVLSFVNYNLILDSKTLNKVAIEEFPIGMLQVPSGNIVVCDPLVMPDTKPLLRRVKPGAYPVKLYIAKLKDAGDRYALAKLEFQHKRADKWVLATSEGDNVSELNGKDEYFGFPVDAGLGAFFDYESGKAYNSFSTQFDKEHVAGNIYDDLLANEFKKNANKQDPKDAGNWTNFKIPRSNLNIMMFQSGFGDGNYPAYWGMTNSNEVVSLVIDFQVLDLPRLN